MRKSETGIFLKKRLPFQGAAKEWRDSKSLSQNRFKDTLNYLFQNLLSTENFNPYQKNRLAFLRAEQNEKIIKIILFNNNLEYSFFQKK